MDVLESLEAKGDARMLLLDRPHVRVKHTWRVLYGFLDRLPFLEQLAAEARARHRLRQQRCRDKRLLQRDLLDMLRVHARHWTRTASAGTAYGKGEAGERNESAMASSKTKLTSAHIDDVLVVVKGGEIRTGSTRGPQAKTTTTKLQA